MIRQRIALSIFLAISLVALAACQADDSATADDVPTADGIGTSPSDPTADQALLAHSDPCGLWIGVDEVHAEARHTAAVTNGDIVQLTLAGGLSCSTLIAAVPTIEESWHGYAVVYYIHAPGFVAKGKEFDLAHPHDGLYSPEYLKAFPQSFEKLTMVAQGADPADPNCKTVDAYVVGDNMAQLVLDSNTNSQKPIANQWCQRWGACGTTPSGGILTCCLAYCTRWFDGTIWCDE